ncbi:MAG: hypothetical protein Kow0059_01590 [Candidatus Sumerlaeia bacterium]
MSSLTRILTRINWWREKKQQAVLMCERGALGALGALLILTPFEREFSAPIMVLLAVLLVSWTGIILITRGGRPLILAACVEAVLVAVAWGLSLMAGVEPPGRSLLFFAREMAFPALVILAVFFTLRLPSPGELSWKAKVVFVLLGLLFVWVVMGGFLSVDPEESFVAMRREWAPGMLVFLSLIHFGSTFRRLRGLALCAFGAALVVGALAVGQWALYRWSYEIQNWKIRRFLVQEHKMILPADVRPESPFYVQFPFRHYSTLGTYLALGLTAIFFTGALLEHKPSRQWVQWSALAGAGGIVAANYGPALWAALLAGGVYFALTRPRQLLLVAALGVCVAAWRPVLFITPAPVELDPPDMLRVLWFGDPLQRERPDWSQTVRLIKQSPVWGAGFGWRNLRNTIERIQRRENLPRLPVYQNFYLQWTAQTGLVGASLLGLLFAVQLWWVVRRLVEVRRPAGAWLQRKALTAWLGALLAMLILGGHVYLLRDRLGLIVWMILGLMTNFMLQSQPLERK